MLKEMLIRQEGYRRTPYKCTAGKTTIGVGRNLEDVGLSDDEVNYLLNNDIHRVYKELDTFPFSSGLSEERYTALCSMLFQLGLARFKKFKKMLAALEEEDYEEAADQMLDSAWYRQTPVRAEELARIVRTGVL